MFSLFPSFVDMNKFIIEKTVFHLFSKHKTERKNTNRALLQCFPHTIHPTSFHLLFAFRWHFLSDSVDCSVGMLFLKWCVLCVGKWASVCVLVFPVAFTAGAALLIHQLVCKCVCHPCPLGLLSLSVLFRSAFQLLLNCTDATFFSPVLYCLRSHRPNVDINLRMNFNCAWRGQTNCLAGQPLWSAWVWVWVWVWVWPLLGLGALLSHFSVVGLIWWQ